MAEVPLTLLGRRLPRGLELRTLTLAPGRERPYRPAEWRDALVVLEQGTLELEGTHGRRVRLRPGAVLCLDGLPLRVIRNPGPGLAVVVAATRCR